MDRAFKAFITDKVRAQRLPLRSDLALDIEIGAGAGLHAIQHSGEHPTRQLIAIEHTRERFQKLEQRKNSHPDRENLHIVHANAISWIAAHCPLHSIDQCYLLYPNPWPKPRHKNQRWHRMSFMGFLLSRLKPTGSLTLATNLEWYMEEASSWFQHHWQCQITLTSIQPTDIFTARTHFERKYLQRGETCYNIAVKPLEISRKT